MNKQVGLIQGTLERLNINRIRASLTWCHVPGNTAFEKLRQEDHYAFEASLGYMLSSRITWTTD